MLLVPRQLLRSGMTGSVPYYGGRFTPAQAYAASHPSAPPPDPPGAQQVSGSRASCARTASRVFRDPPTPIRRRRFGTCAIPGCSPRGVRPTC